MSDLKKAMKTPTCRQLKELNLPISSKHFFFSAIFLLSVITGFQPVFSQDANSSGEIHGDFELNAQYYRTDSAIGAPKVSENTLVNGYLNILYMKGPFTAAVRFESYLNVLQGYDSRFSGNSGIPYKFLNYKKEELEVTAGNFYEQFGSGMILRTYEDRGLGLDNSLEGIRVKYAVHGIRVKGIIGKQRYYFLKGAGIVRGADGEVDFNELFTGFSESKIRLTGGGGLVSKYQSTETVEYTGLNLRVPQNVGAAAGRLNFLAYNFNINGEYAYKINDPSDINGYIYKPGEGLFVTATYARKGLGIFLGAKRIDNMSFKSERSALGTDLNINYLPALTKQHTYSLFAYYPYGTQPNGEIGYQAELVYRIRKETKLGGKYGTEISVNYSNFSGLDTTHYPASDDTVTRMGYKSDYFGSGEPYFNDFNIEINRKINQKLKMILAYAYQSYNKDIIQRLVGYGTVYSHIGMVEAIYKFTSTHSLRAEIQHLYTKQDDGSWAYGLLEWGAGEHFYLMVMDQYNYGNDVPGKRVHYYTGGITYIKSTMRIALSYGRQRAGFYCSGGVCRYVPASNGVTLTVISSF